MMGSGVRACAALCAALGLASTADAGGLYAGEFATVDMGAAGAGALARASDASTALMNPSGMTYLDSHQLNLGLAPGFGRIQFDHDATSPSGGGNGGNQGGFIPLLGSSYVHKISDRFRAGLGIFSISGASLDPANDWAGRNQMQEITLFSLTFVPSVAVRLTDWLSVGAGPAITYGTLDWKLQIPPGGPAGGEQVKFDELDDWAVAPFVGVMLQPLDELRIGFVYQGKTDLELKGDAELPGPFANPNLEVDLPLARAYRVDVRWQATDALAFSLGAAYEDWSALENTTLDLGNISSTVRLGFKDTWKLRGGVHWQVNEKWMAQTGLSYDSSALRNKDRTVALPIDEQWRWGIGGVYSWTENTNVGFAFEYVNLGSGKVNNAAVRGEYDDNHLLFFMVNLNFAKLPWDGMASF